MALFMIHLCLTGFLLPGEFDTEGQCISIQLYTSDEKVYSLTDGTNKQNLESFLRQTVRIEGGLVIEERSQLVTTKVRLQSD